jgi:hypothetical protein
MALLTRSWSAESHLHWTESDEEDEGFRHRQRDESENLDEGEGYNVVLAEEG